MRSYHSLCPGAFEVGVPIIWGVSYFLENLWGATAVQSTCRGAVKPLDAGSVLPGPGSCATPCPSLHPGPSWGSSVSQAPLQRTDGPEVTTSASLVGDTPAGQGPCCLSEPYPEQPTQDGGLKGWALSNTLDVRGTSETRVIAL